MSAAARGVGRIRSLWRNMPLMWAFFLYAAGCILASVVLSLVIMLGLLSAYGALENSVWEGRVEVNGGPYVYDERAGELIPAVSIEMENAPDRITFLGIRGDARDDDADAIDVINAETGASIGYATLDMVKEDPSITVYDWGGNYIGRDRENGGNPYRPVSLDGSNLAAYDARERAERAPVDSKIAEMADGSDDFAISNVGYYVNQDKMSLETPTMTGLRIATIITPFAVLILISVLAFRRFYRKRLGGPLEVFCGCAARVASRDLDFTTPRVTGREFSRLGFAFERMRASLEASQRELWRTSEERRRLNAAFAHDLRTPVTVLKGTVEMARLRAERGEAIDCRTLRTLGDQADRLESYARAMSGIAKLEDRKVVRKRIDAADLGAELRSHARDCVSSRRPEVSLAVDVGGLGRACIAVDPSLAEEVLDNLLGNACSHARGQVELVLGLDDASGVLTMRVTDDGPGFTPEALRRGCEPFFGEARGAEHFGLGLNIVQTLARLHGGTVELANGETDGGSVTVTLEVAGDL